ncbi:MAG: YcxB family protein [Chloroflexi bacterium]|nr:YcxB family protein [Chloroflexota bacterium]
MNRTLVAAHCSLLSAHCPPMQFTVDLQPEEYRRAMLWHQFASTPGKRMNGWAAWAILVAAPLTVVVLLAFAPDGLSFWFWPVAILALLYSAYSTLAVRYQIGRQAARLLQTNPALARTHYHLYAAGVQLTGGEEGDEAASLFLPWKEIERVAEFRESFLFFVTDESILIVPKRTLTDETAFRRLLQKAGKTRR